MPKGIKVIPRSKEIYLEIWVCGQIEAREVLTKEDALKLAAELTKAADSLPKPHPHAESMRLYALDAMETDKPWERWQISLDNDYCSWYNCSNHPDWSTRYVYRRKSQ